MRKNRDWGSPCLPLSRLSGPCSVYVHIPFCLRKCPYCSFYSLPLRRGEEEGYLSRLVEEIRFHGEMLGGRVRAETVYFGGGTPSLLSPGQWSRIFSVLRSCIPFEPGAEITVEANPESLSAEHLSIWKDWGVTRVSVGVQSFSDRELRWLERPHGAAEARRSLEMSVKAGFSVSADFIFGLEGQTLRQWKASLSEALDRGTEHVSIYQLSIEQGCRWFSNPPGEGPDGYPFYRWSQWYLPRKGFDQYEIASFCLQDRQCRHNLAYWTGKSVVALGAGAWGCLEGTRYRNEPSVEKYSGALRERGNAFLEAQVLPRKKEARQAAVLLLRTKWGIPFRDFQSRYGSNSLKEILRILREDVPKDCIAFRPDGAALTKRGMRVGNAIWSLLI